MTMACGAWRSPCCSRQFSDLDSAVDPDRRSAEASIERDDFDYWCGLAGVNPIAARERLALRDRAA